MPACSKPPLRGFGLWQSLPHPTHGRRIADPSGLLVGLHRGIGVAPRSEAWPGMATVVRLQDGEGWTPRNIHQSVLMLGTICHRLLASEQHGGSAIQRACIKYAGEEAPQCLLGWPASAEPPLIASGPLRTALACWSFARRWTTEPTGTPFRSCTEAV